ncbi:MAG TPA: hypothetical protein VF768_08450 [Holophagaceae bacterium]
MNRAQPSFSLQEQPAKAEKPSSPTGLVFQTWQKGLLLCLALGILYFRMLKRKQAKVVVCSHCGKKNPPHLSNCQKCAAPLLRL